MFIYVCMYACVYKFYSETQVPLLLFRRSTRSNPPSMFFECRRQGEFKFHSYRAMQGY